MHIIIAGLVATLASGVACHRTQERVPVIVTNSKDVDEARIELAAYRWASRVAVVKEVTIKIIDSGAATGEVTFKDGRIAKLVIDRQRVGATPKAGVAMLIPKGTQVSMMTSQGGDKGTAHVTGFLFPWAVTSAQMASATELTRKAKS